jgi:uncharacterized alkaline shock family protein YloU
MSDTASNAASGEPVPDHDTTARQQDSREALRSQESRGSTATAKRVAEIAGAAARDVRSVHDLYSGTARTIGGVRERVPGRLPGATRGVHADVHEREAAVDLDLVLDYSVPISEVAAEVRTRVITDLERITGLDVVEVNITIDDVDLPGGEDGKRVS